MANLRFFLKTDQKFFVAGNLFLYAACRAGEGDEEDGGNGIIHFVQSYELQGN